ncbi:MAG TPA: protein kinase [Gemmatimonadaceae bacterium]
MADALERLTAALEERYAIERQIGVGGMATVYLARDLRHDRLVALKLLRPELGAVIGADRFLSEIRTTARLQHPHILPLFDSGEADGLLYYVMPYVEGVSLRHRLDREKQLPVGEAVRIASEVASALDYAHRHDVIHRDIKPENILLHDGRALVADFGIALAVSNAGATRMTETGMSLGTPHYMSPEQAMGEREITARSDVYALGAVTYEMLTGEPPFTGPTAQAIVAKVVTEEPRPLIPKRRTIPPHVELAVITALEKLPADRYASAAEFADALQAPAATAPTAVRQAAVAPVAVKRDRRVLGAAALGAAAVLALAFLAGRMTAGERGTASTPVGRFVLTTGDEHRWTGAGFVGLTLSPDGTTLVYLGQNARGTQLYRRRLDELVPTPIPGTEGAVSPFFSPNGQSIAFYQGNTIRRVSLAGGAPATVPTGDVIATAASWLDDQTLAITGLDGSIHTVGGSGGVTVVARPDSTQGEAALLPFDVLPDGKTVIALAIPGAAASGRAYGIDLESGRRRPILDQVVAGLRYDPAGYLAWVLPDGTLLGAPFDAGRLQITSTPVTLAHGVRVSVGGPPQFSVSRAGNLVYVPEVPFELRLVNRDGTSVPATELTRRFHSPRISPDGRRIAMDFSQQGSRDVWSLDLRQGTLTRLTFDNDGHDPVWSSDGNRIAYATARGGVIGMFSRSADGSGGAESLYVGRTAETVGAFIPGGNSAVVISVGTGGSFDLTLMPLSGARTPEQILSTPFNEFYPAISPDGRWLAYASDESGQSEIYVRPFPGPGAKLVISQSGGSEPVWSRDGRELFYRGFGQQGSPLIAVTVQTSPEFQVLARRELFDVSEFEAAVPHANYDVGPDGRFAMVYQGRLSELVLVQNWTEEVRRRATTGQR